MILVVGATGLVGRDICRRLVARGDPVRALVRETSDPVKVRELTDAGVEAVVGDLRDRASLDAACSNVTAVIETAAAMPFAFIPGVNDINTTDPAGVQSLLEAASAAGVAHVVYMSFSRHFDLDFPLGNAKRRVEARVRESADDVHDPPALLLHGGLAWPGGRLRLWRRDRRDLWRRDGADQLGRNRRRGRARRSLPAQPGRSERHDRDGRPRAAHSTRGGPRLRGRRPPAVHREPCAAPGAGGAAGGRDRRHGPLVCRSDALLREGRRDPDGGDRPTFGMELTPVREFAVATVAKLAAAVG